MKKLLLAALAAASITQAQATLPFFVYEGGTCIATGATQLEDGKTYVIHDNNAARSAFRYANSSGIVSGEHNDGLTSHNYFTSEYIWVAESSNGNWTFKNLSNNKFLPEPTDNGGVTLGDVAGEFVVTKVDGTDDEFIVKHPSNGIAWDGNGDNDSYNMVYYQGDGHQISFFPVVNAEEYPVSIEPGKKYKFKAISPVGVTKGREGQCLNLTSLDGGNRVTLAVEGTDIFLTKSDTEANQWRFQIEDETGDNMSASLWNSAVSSTPAYWSLINAPEEFATENPVVMIYQNTIAPGYSGFLGFEAELPGGYSDYGLAKALQADKYPYWEVIDADAAVKVQLTFKRNADDNNPVIVEEMYSTGIEFPTFEAFTCDNANLISKDNVNATYTLKEGKKMRIYNERAAKYVYVSNDNKLEQKEVLDETSTIFYQIPMGSEGGFAIYCPSQDKFFGFVDADNVKLPADEFNPSPVKWYTGKYDGKTSGNIYYPIYADWIGLENETNNTVYLNDFGHHSVCRWTRIDDGSKWIIVTDQENFEENWKMRQDLMDARGDYEDACLRLGETPNQDLLDFANNFRFNGNVNLPVSDEAKSNLQSLIDKVAEAEEKWPSIIMEATKLYTIVSNGRGALVYDETQDCMTTTGANGTADSENNNHLWGFVHVGDKFYLYNRGALKFASAYIEHSGDSHISEYAWTIGDIPTAIELSNEAFGRTEALHNNKFIIKGGFCTTQPAGMMIINGDNTKIPCALGYNDIKDGTAFTLTAIRDTDQDETMKAKVTEGFAKVNDEIENICVVGVDYDSDVHGKQVGHFTEAAVNALGTAKANAQAMEDKEAAMYAALEAARNFKKTETNYRSVENGNVYTIADSEGNIHYTDGESHLSAIELPEKINVKMQNWVASVAENGKVTFSHSHDTSEVTPAQVRAAVYYDGVNVVNFAVGDNTEFTVNRTSTPGRVTLGDDTSKQYIITHVSTNAKDAETTEIAEIGVAGEKVDAVYDLQGRRMAAPVKGINIINGKKVLVK